MKEWVFIWIFMTFIIWTAREKWDIRLYSCTIYKYREGLGWDFTGFREMWLRKLPELVCGKEYIN